MDKSFKARDIRAECLEKKPDFEEQYNESDAMHLGHGRCRVLRACKVTDSRRYMRERTVALRIAPSRLSRAKRNFAEAARAASFFCDSTLEPHV